MAHLVSNLVYIPDIIWIDIKARNNLRKVLKPAGDLRGYNSLYPIRLEGSITPSLKIWVSTKEPSNPVDT
jgi:hypothetical protein